MNKQDYLIKKGRIPNPSNGEIYIIHSTRTGVTIKKVPVWETGVGMQTSFNGVEKVQKPYTTYKFEEFPYVVNIPNAEMYHENDGLSTGYGDCWCWSYFTTVDEKIANKLFEEETKRVTDKYLSGKINDDEEYFPTM